MSLKNESLYKVVFKRERVDWNPPGIDSEALKKLWRTLRDPAVQAALGDTLWIVKELTVQAGTAARRAAVEAEMAEVADAG